MKIEVKFKSWLKEEFLFEILFNQIYEIQDLDEV